MEVQMKVVKKDLPTEGVKIGGVHFLPGKVTDVSAEMGKVLIERKGFKEVKSPKTSKSKED